MFAITSNQRRRTRFVKTVRKIHKEHFGLSEGDLREQNQIWRDWLELKKQEPRDLIALVKNDKVSGSFRGRALAILLVPAKDLVPFDWIGEKDSLNDFLHMFGQFDFSELPDILQQFMFKLLPTCMAVAQAADAEREENIRRTLFFYKNRVVFALSRLAEDDPMAETLFGLWQPLDPIVYWNMDFASGYDPFQTMLCAAIPNVWKWRADQLMRDIVQAELEGKTEPRAEHEQADRQYLSLIQLTLYSEELPYELELFVSQVQFIMSVNRPGQQTFDNWKVNKVLGLLAGDRYLALRRRFGRHIVLDDHGEYGGFKAYSSETLQAARMMLADAAPDDAELRDKLNELIADAEARFAKERADADAARAESDAVMAKMSA